MNNFKYLNDEMMTGVAGGFLTPGRDVTEATPEWDGPPDAMDNGIDGRANGLSHKPV